MSKENTTKYAVMGILKRGGASGYDIRKQIDESVGFFWKESYGQIYPILKMLFEEGWATKQTEKQSGKPDRIVYSLTDKGREQLDSWLDQPLNYMHTERNELLLKLFFSSRGNTRQNIDNIANYRNRLAEEVCALDAIEQRIVGKNLDEEISTYALISVKYGQLAYRAFVDWCDYAIKNLNSLKEANNDSDRKEEK